jgi:hypothetical protein
MTGSTSIAAIYDFEIFPFALGDVLTWNVRTAMRCEELGRERVDIYICADQQYPTGLQRGIINSQNFDLFFSELFGAFSTHPKLGNIHIFRQRGSLIARLQEISAEDEVNVEAVRDYLGILNYRVLENASNRVKRTLFSRVRGNQFVRKIYKRYLPSLVKNQVIDALERSALLSNEEVVNRYFTKYIYSHESINAFAARRGGIPLLRPSLGCEPDIDELIARRFAGKKIVPFHLRLRRLDAGYGGEHSYSRDSDFLEWYDFLKEAAGRYPEVEFIALGRLQEKPLELLRLPNVTSLRIFGMGLNHELTLMLKSDLFIGTSSGFAALANFSSIPYFITHMNPGSCQAYAIPDGADRLPFARENQKLIYARETSELLMSLLETGLALPRRPANRHRVEAETSGSGEIDVRGWLNARLRLMNSAATTSRFFTGDKYRHEETAYLLFLSLDRARQALLCNAREEAKDILRRLEKNFPDLCNKLPQYLTLKEVITDENMDQLSMRACLETLDIQVSGFVGKACSTPAAREAGWRPLNWTVVGSEFKPLLEEPQPALTIQATSSNSYWHTERFVCSRSDGKIIPRFDARISASPSLHRMYIFQDGKYHAVGEFFVESEWRTFEIPITTNPGSILEFQISDQADASKWLSIRDFHVVGGGPLPLMRQAPVAIPMAAWTTNWQAGTSCSEAKDHDCLQWTVADKKGYVQTPELPQPGAGGLLIRFEARADRPATSFTSAYLWEGKKYRTVAHYAFSSEWVEFTLLLEPDPNASAKFQIDYPDSVESLSIRDFQAIPVVRDKILVT